MGAWLAQGRHSSPSWSSPQAGAPLTDSGPHPPCKLKAECQGDLYIGAIINYPLPPKTGLWYIVGAVVQSTFCVNLKEKRLKTQGKTKKKQEQSSRISSYHNAKFKYEQKIISILFSKEIHEYVSENLQILLTKLRK